MAARLEALEGAMKQRSDALGSHSPAMMAVLETARQVADTDANILILGESGTGKGELARAIHTWSRRSKKAFVTINCPSLSADLMESELFGHRSEERRVGNEGGSTCRSRGWPYRTKKK